MGDNIAKAQDLIAKADKKIKGWALFGNKYEEALELLEKAVNYLKLGKACALPPAPRDCLVAPSGRTRLLPQCNSASSCEDPG